MLEIGKHSLVPPEKHYHRLNVIFDTLKILILFLDMVKRQTSGSSGALQPNSFLQPSQFLDPSFQGSNNFNGTQGSSGNSSMSSGSQQFMPSFLDPSKFGKFGQQQPGSGGSQNGSSSSGGGAPSGGSFAPNMFINPNGGQQTNGGNFNIFDPSMFLQG